MVLNSSRLVLATSCGVYLYDMPSLESLLDDVSSTHPRETIDLFPSWSTCGSFAMSAPVISPPVTYGHPKPRTRCMIWTGHDVHTLDVPAHPLQSPEAGDCIQYSTSRVDTKFTHQTIQAVGYGIGVHRHRSTDAPSIIVSAAVGDVTDPGYARLGRSSNAICQTTLKWEPGVCVVDMSVDELSGNIAVLDCDEKSSTARRLKIYHTLD